MLESGKRSGPSLKELQVRCVSANLPKSGTKADLLERLRRMQEQIEQDEEDKEEEEDIHM